MAEEPAVEYPSPSAYLRVSSLTTDQLLKEKQRPVAPVILEFLDMSQHSTNRDSVVPIDQPLFEATPNELRFQQFEPLQTYEIALVLRNVDRVARKITVLQSASPVFKIIPPKDQAAKVAAGMHVVYLVRFSPEQARDYADELICITERERFALAIRATGPRAALDLPDAVVFPASPVKVPATKILLVRNVGRAPASFRCWGEGPFGLTPAQGELAAHDSLQFQATFTPTRAGPQQGQAFVQYSTGEVVALALQGQAEDLDVALSTAKLFMPATFMTSRQSRTITITNSSKHRVHYEWKQHATQLEEDASKAQATGDLTAALATQSASASIGLGTLGDARLLAQPLANQTLRTRTRALQLNPLLYQDEVFVLEPSAGDIWPNSSTDVTVTFAPDHANLFSRLVYLDVTGREGRLALKLQGEGLGPAAELSFNNFDLGQVFRASSNRFEVKLRNVGTIMANFALQSPPSPHASFFTFEPTFGSVAPGASLAISIDFAPLVMGSVDVPFAFAVQDAVQPLPLRLCATVIAPTFHASVSDLDFGAAPVGFVCTRTFVLTNTSPVPLAFRARVDPGNPHARDFDIVPPRATIPPHGSAHLQVDLLSGMPGIYDTFLAIDVEGVGEELLTVPIFAQSTVADVRVASVLPVDFEHCFVDLPIERTFALENLSTLPAKFDVLPVDTAAVAISVALGAGIIPPLSTVTVVAALTARQLGTVTGALRVLVAGANTLLPLPCVAVGEGPVLSASPRRLDWARQTVLVRRTLAVTLRNESPVPALFSCTTGTGLFSVTPSGGTVAPGQAVDVQVEIFLTDTVAVDDVLHVAIAGGVALAIPLVATGVGSVVASEPSLANGLDFGTQLSTVECTRVFTLTNHGPRGIKLAFTLDEPVSADGTVARILRGSAAVVKPSPACPRPVAPGFSLFGVWPERLTLAAGQSAAVEVRGLSASAGVASDSIVCSGVYEGTIKVRPLFKALVTATFIQPMLVPTPAALDFGVTTATLATPQVVAWHNVTALPLAVSFTCSGPFAVTALNGSAVSPGDSAPAAAAAIVPPGGSAELAVVFDNTLAGDKLTRQVEGRLVVAYDAHPQVDTVSLAATVTFPNVTITPATVDFGTRLNDTRSTIAVTLANPGAHPVEYHWTLAPAPGLAGVPLATLAQVFDLLPLRGSVAAQSTAAAVASFHAHPDCAFAATALLHVRDGPTYHVPLSGRAAGHAYTLSAQAINFGSPPLGTSVERTLTIRNTGLVDVPVTVLSAVPFVTLNPAAGSVPPGGELTLNITYESTLPDEYEATLRVQVGHGVAERVLLSCRGTYPHVSADAPRVPSAAMHALEAEARRNVQAAMRAAGKGAGAKKLDPWLVCPEIDRLAIRAQTNPVTDAPNTTPASSLVLTGSGVGACPVAAPTQVPLPPYLVDFGPMVPGASASRTVTVRNDGNTTVSLTVGKRALEGVAGWGFSLAPDRVLKLPQGEHVAFTATYTANSTLRMPLALGLKEVAVPVTIVDGPRLSFVLRATVVDPSVVFDVPSLDFGAVVVGAARVMTVTLHNPSPLPCSWSFATLAKRLKAAVAGKRGAALPTLSKAAQAARQRELDTARCFSLTPSAGRLRAGAKMTVHVRFVPSEEGDSHTTLVLALDNGAAGPTLSVRGFGLEPQLALAWQHPGSGAPLLSSTVGPVFPGGEPVDTALCITNKSPFDVEFFCVELDSDHVSEETMLRAVDGFDSRQRLFLPTREPGAPLPQELYQHAALCAANAAAAAASAAPAVTSAGVFDEDEEVDLAASAISIEVTDYGRASLASLLRRGSSAGDGSDNDDDNDENISVGAGSARPFSASTALTALTALDNNNTNVGVGRLLGLPARAALSRYLGFDSKRYQRETDQLGFNAVVAGPRRAGTTNVATQLAAHFSAVAVSVDAIVDAAVASGTAAGKQAQAHWVAQALQNTDEQDGDVFRAIGAFSQAMGGGAPTSVSEEEKTQRLPEDLLFQIISEHVKQPAELRGVVIDGLVSKYGTVMGTLNAVLRALAGRRHFVAVIVAVDGSVAEARYGAQQAVEMANRQVADERAATAAQQAPSISEDDYNALDDESREQFDLSVLEYNRTRLLKKKFEADERERRFLEERRREEDELSMAKAKKGKKQQQGPVGKTPRPTSSNSQMDTVAPPPRAAARGGVLGLPGSKRPTSPSSQSFGAGGDDSAELGAGPFVDAREEVVTVLADWDRQAGRVRAPRPAPSPAAAPVGSLGPTGSRRMSLSPASVRRGSAIGTTPSANKKGGSAKKVAPEPLVILDDISTIEGVPCAHVDTSSAADPAAAFATLMTTYRAYFPPVDLINKQLAMDWSEQWPLTLDLDVVNRPVARPAAATHPQFFFFDAAAEQQAKAAALAAAAEAEAEAEEERKMGGKRGDSKAGKRPGSGLKTRGGVAKPGTSLAVAKSTDAGGAGTALAITSHRLVRFRWVVPAGGSLTLHVRFAAAAVGTFDQTFTFETVKGGLRFPARLRGLCALPRLDVTPAKLFSRVVASVPAGSFPAATFVLSTQRLEFGPLLCGKSRDNYKADAAGRAHRMVVNLVNPGPFPAKVSAAFFSDLTFATFTLDPPQQEVAPGATGSLSLWAFPKATAMFEDRLIVCVEGNPAPLVVHVAAEGVEPALEVDRKQLQFDRTLVRRNDTRSLVLRNKTRLPVAWAIAGTEQLGEEFTFSALRGVIDPEKDYTLDVNFRSEKVMHISKRTIRVEVSDAENIAGVVQTESVQVSAEAYDGAADLNFPKGSPDSGLDFDIVRVGDEKLLACTLRNKGKYELKYTLSVDAALCKKLNIAPGVVAVSPDKGALPPGEKPVSLKVTVRPSAALKINAAPLLRCALIDPHIGETIWDYPITVSFVSVFSTYALTPARGLHFGPVQLGTPKSVRELLLENTGPFEFKYHILAVPHAPSSLDGASSGLSSSTARKSVHTAGSRPGSPKRFPRASIVAMPGGPGGPSQTMMMGAGSSGSLSTTSQSTVPPAVVYSQRINIGCFTVFPATGTVAAGATVKILVEADPQRVGVDDTAIAVHVDNRVPHDHANGHIYQLSVEACHPELTTNLAALFPDLPILASVGAADHAWLPAFATDDRVLHFGPVIVNQTASVRVKITNQGKVAGTVVLAPSSPASQGLVNASSSSTSTTGPSRAGAGAAAGAGIGAGAGAGAANPAVGGSTNAGTPARPRTAPGTEMGGFTVTPARLSLAPRASGVVTVTFSPTALSAFMHDFDAMLEGLADGAPGGRVTFGLRGQGTLPRVTLLSPTTKSHLGAALVQFRRTRVGTKRLVHIELHNPGLLPATALLRIVPVEARVLSSRATRAGGKGAGNASGGGGGGKSKVATASSQPAISSPSKVANVGKSLQEVDEQADDQAAPAALETPFELVDGPAAIEIMPGAVHRVPMVFSPTGPGSVAATLSLSVLSNDFETAQIELTGDGFVDDFEWEGLPDDGTLDLGRVRVGAPAITRTVHLVNHAPTPLRVAWDLPASSGLAVSPAVAHVAVGARCSMTFSFSAQEVRPFGATPCVCRVGRIALAESEAGSGATWASTDRVVAWTVTELPGGRLERAQVSTPVPEPAYTLLEGAQRDVAVSVTAGALAATFVCGAPAEIPFQDTMLLHTRVFSFPLRNPGEVPLAFSWALTDDALAPSAGDSAPFSVHPAEGIVAPGATQEIAVHCTPRQLRQWTYLLTASLPGVEGKAVEIVLRAASTQPFVHFDVPSDDSAALGGDVGAAEPPSALDGQPLTRLHSVVVATHGLGKPTTVKIPFRNTAAAPYAYRWISLDDGGAKLSPQKGRGLVSGAFACPTFAGTLEGGATAVATFVYTPPSATPEDSWWCFEIPAQNVSVPFVLRGRPLEPDVSLALARVSLPPTLVGQAASTIVTLVNRDSVAHAFSFNNQVLVEARRGAGVALEPATGTIAAGASVQVSVRVTPTLEQQLVVHLRCDIAARSAPLPLTLSLEGYRHHVRLAAPGNMAVKPVGAVLVGTSTAKPARSTSAKSAAATAKAADADKAVVPLGTVALGDQQSATMMLTNAGKFPVDYEWVFPPPPPPPVGVTTDTVLDKIAKGHQSRVQSLALTPVTGTLPPQSTVPCTVVFAPDRVLTLGAHGLALHCRIARGGPVFALTLTGAAVLPAVTASVTAVDFGPHLIYALGQPVATASVVLSNAEAEPVDVVCLWTNTPDLRVDLPVTRIPGRGSVTATLTFAPREARAYADSVAFMVNGTRRVAVAVTGRGNMLRLDATLPNAAGTRDVPLVLGADGSGVVALGALQAGQSTSRVLKITNNSGVAVSFRLTGDFRNLASLGVTCSALQTIALAPKADIAVTLTFAPKSRVAPFREDVGVEVFGTVRPLLTLTGSCQARVVALDHDQLQFGSVVAQSTAMQRVLLTNHGDLGCRFQWTPPPEFSTWFTLSPLHGYLTPGLELACELTCHPPSAAGTLRFENIPCQIEGEKLPLRLDVTAVAVAPQLEQAPVAFSVQVRSTETKSVRVTNPSTTTPWRLAPSVDHPFFSAPASLVVGPGETVTCDVTYAPLTMTNTTGAAAGGGAAGGASGSSLAGALRGGKERAADKDSAMQRLAAAAAATATDRPAQHTATLFIPMPDGTALVVPLVGVALAPKPIRVGGASSGVGGVAGGREAPCKQWHTERVLLTNWLPRVQRLHVTLTRTKADAATALRGPEFVEVPAHGTADYPLEVFAHREGTTVAEVLALNDATGEYITIEVTFKHTPPGVLAVIPLATRVREGLTHSLVLSNPLPTPVTMTMTCAIVVGEDGKEFAGRGAKAACPDILGPTTLKLPARCVDLAYSFEFLPLVPRAITARLVLTSAELGVSAYDLRLSSTPAPPLPPRVFVAALGDAVTQRYKLVNYTPTRTDMAVVCSSKEFVAPPSVNAAPAPKTGADLVFDVTFEPCKLGEVKAVMTVSSAAGGEYTCPLVGQCGPPAPAGPHGIRAGGKLVLPFKNVLATGETFACAVDNAAFSVKDKEVLKAGETRDIVVKHEGGKDSPVVRALLTVTCVTGPLAGTVWPHYLVATPATSAAASSNSSQQLAATQGNLALGTPN